MKIRVLTILMILCSAPVLAQDADIVMQGGFDGPQEKFQGGFTGPTASPVTVEKVKTMRDGTHVILEGHLEKYLGGKAYDFRDVSGSGAIVVEIKQRHFKNQKISPKDKVRIEGVVDKDFNSVEIEANKITTMP